jgi:hypothetical protein
VSWVSDHLTTSTRQEGTWLGLLGGDRHFHPYSQSTYGGLAGWWVGRLAGWQAGGFGGCVVCAVQDTHCLCGAGHAARCAPALETNMPNPRNQGCASHPCTAVITGRQNIRDQGATFDDGTVYTCHLKAGQWECFSVFGNRNARVSMASSLLLDRGKDSTCSDLAPSTQFLLSIAAYVNSFLADEFCTVIHMKPSTG